MLRTVAVGVYAKTPLGKKRAKAAAGDEDEASKGKKGGKKPGKKKWLWAFARKWQSLVVVLHGTCNFEALFGNVYIMNVWRCWRLRPHTCCDSVTVNNTCAVIWPFDSDLFGNNIFGSATDSDHSKCWRNDVLVLTEYNITCWYTFFPFRPIDITLYLII